MSQSGVSRKTVIQSGDVRVTEMTLDAGASMPAHHHSEISDVFYGLSGSLELQAGDMRHDLGCGCSRSVEPGVVHAVRNVGDSEARFLLVQFGGKYDFLLPE